MDFKMSMPIRHIQQLEDGDFVFIVLMRVIVAEKSCVASFAFPIKVYHGSNGNRL